MTDPSVNGQDRSYDSPIRAFEVAIAALREQLDHERGRGDRAEQRLEELRTALADAQAAERVAAGEAMALRTERDQFRQWSRWRRLRWALRGKSLISKG